MFWVIKFLTFLLSNHSLEKFDGILFRNLEVYLYDFWANYSI